MGLCGGRRRDSGRGAGSVCRATPGSRCQKGKLYLALGDDSQCPVQNVGVFPSHCGSAVGRWLGPPVPRRTHGDDTRGHHVPGHHLTSASSLVSSTRTKVIFLSAVGATLALREPASSEEWTTLSTVGERVPGRTGALAQHGHPSAHTCAGTQQVHVPHPCVRGQAATDPTERQRQKTNHPHFKFRGCGR